MTRTKEEAWALSDELLNPYPEQEPGPEPEVDEWAVPDYPTEACEEPKEGYEADQ